MLFAGAVLSTPFWPPFARPAPGAGSEGAPLVLGLDNAREPWLRINADKRA